MFIISVLLDSDSLLMTSEIVKENKKVLSYKKIHSEMSEMHGELFFNLIESNSLLSATNLYLLKFYLESITIFDILNEDNLVDIRYKKHLDEIESIIFCKDNALVLNEESNIWINQYKKIYNQYKKENTQILFDLKSNEFYVILLFEEYRSFYKPKTIIPLHREVIKNITNKHINPLIIHSVEKENFLKYSSEYYVEKNLKPYSYHGEQKTITFNDLIQHMDILIHNKETDLDISLIKEQKNKLLPYLEKNKDKKIMIINN